MTNLHEKLCLKTTYLKAQTF